MDFDISELFAAATIIAPIVGGVWFAVRHFVTDLTLILKQYSESRAETLRFQHNLGDLESKLVHLRNSHKQLSINVLSEFKDCNDKLKESDEKINDRLKEVEAQLNRILGNLEGISYGRRSED